MENQPGTHDAVTRMRMLVDAGASFVAGGFLGIDSRLNLDEHGIWNRNNQRTVEYLTVDTALAGT